MLAAKTPVAVLCAVGRAGGLGPGFLLTLAADVAAMGPARTSPATRVGQGEKLDETTPPRRLPTSRPTPHACGGRHLNVIWPNSGAADRPSRSRRP